MLVALVTILMVACVAMAVDIGYTTLSRSELQNAADASVVAGAAQLQASYGPYNTATFANARNIVTSAESSAVQYCQRYCGYNTAGGVSGLSMLSSDIEFGFTDANGIYTANAPGYPNTVKVIARRDATANTPLSLFFAPAIGTSSLNLSASSAATVFSGDIIAFNPNGGGEVANSSGGGFGGFTWDGGSGSGCGCTLLPIAFDVNWWNQFLLDGTSPDGAVHTDASGNPQIQIYPTSHTAPGCFGLLCIGAPTNSDPSYVNWILNGPSGSDLAALSAEGEFPVSLSAPKPWKGSPGLKFNLVSDFSSIVGQPRLLPLFSPISQTPYQAAAGCGSNTYYNIVGFAGVCISQAGGNGSNLQVYAQPCGVVDPTAVFDATTLYPAGAAPTSLLKKFTFVPPRLTK